MTMRLSDDEHDERARGGRCVGCGKFALGGDGGLRSTIGT